MSNNTSIPQSTYIQSMKTIQTPWGHVYSPNLYNPTNSSSNRRKKRKTRRYKGPLQTLYSLTKTRYHTPCVKKPLSLFQSLLWLSWQSRILSHKSMNYIRPYFLCYCQQFRKTFPKILSHLNFHKFYKNYIFLCRNRSA